MFSAQNEEPGNGQPTAPGSGQPTAPGSSHPTAPGNGQPTAPGSSQPTATHETLRVYITKDMVATTLFTMRVVTIMGTLLFLLSSFGLFGGYGYKGYLNAMLTSFFTFSIRLYQRKQERQIYTFSKGMYDLFVTEDAGHYMLYTYFYYNQYPFSIYLIPPFLYALLFSVKYTSGLTPFLPLSASGLLSQLNNKVAANQREIKRFIAYTEIFLMLITVWNTLMGYMFFLAPVIHYYFLKLRYQSLRNHSVSLVFVELRLGVEQLSRHPSCPPFVSNLLTKAVAIVSRLAPSQPMRRQA